MLGSASMRKKHFALTERRKAIIRALQGDIPICEAPFQAIAQDLSIPEDEVLDTIREMKAHGVLRRFGATLRHQEIGYRANAMSAWNVPEERVEEVGRLLASLPQVTHCYERPPQEDWPYNLYAMIHCKSEGACERIAQDIARRTGIHDYALLFSSKESKKESMQYF
jgi:DNA-binding Lrp family transcriptional regulator